MGSLKAAERLGKMQKYMYMGIILAVIKLVMSQVIFNTFYVWENYVFNLSNAYTETSNLDISMCRI